MCIKIILDRQAVGFEAVMISDVARPWCSETAGRYSRRSARVALARQEIPEPRRSALIISPREGREVCAPSLGEKQQQITVRLRSTSAVPLPARSERLWAALAASVRAPRQAKRAQPLRPPHARG